MGRLVRYGVDYGGGDNSKTISYEEFQNLSNAEKNSDTTFFIPDYPGTDYVTEGNIVDNLESTDTNKALSANMGRVMNGKLVQAIFIKSFDSATGTLETVSADQLS